MSSNKFKPPVKNFFGEIYAGIAVGFIKQRTPPQHIKQISDTVPNGHVSPQIRSSVKKKRRNC
jgi:hypothetical protein